MRALLFRLLTALFLVSLITACAISPATGIAEKKSSAAKLPILQLTPASFGGSLNLVQRLTFSRLDGKPGDAQALDAVLEIDQDNVSLAGFALGQRILTLHWDGQTIQAQRHPRLPAEADPARILNDVQLVYWPAPAIQAALGKDWSLDATTGQRSLSQGGNVLVTIRYQTSQEHAGIVILENVQNGYRLVIESKPQVAGPLP